MEILGQFSAEIDSERRRAARPQAISPICRVCQLEERVLTSEDADSPFEETVAAFMEGLGYKIDKQVGSAGFKIDLAVRHPDQPGRYMLAVECDGATYHSGLWARERDRLRQEILENMGWRFCRIWSTDWFYRRAEAAQKLRAALEAASSAGSTTRQLESSRRPVPDPTNEPTSSTPEANAFDSRVCRPTNWRKAYLSLWIKSPTR